MTDPIPNTCSHCRHWQATPEKTSGICRRHAPVTMAVVAPMKMAESGMVLKTVWPSTGPKDYCGDFGAPFNVLDMNEVLGQAPGPV